MQPIIYLSGSSPNSVALSSREDDEDDKYTIDLRANGRSISCDALYNTLRNILESAGIKVL